MVLDSTLVNLDRSALVLGLLCLRESWRGSLDPFRVGFIEVGTFEELLYAVGSADVIERFLLPARACEVLVTGSGTV